MTCVHGGAIKPSAGAYVDSREARPPKGALPGVPFGADELRLDPALERLAEKLRRLEDKQAEHTTKAEVAEVRAEHVKKAPKRDELRAKAAALPRLSRGTDHEALAAFMSDHNDIRRFDSRRRTGHSSSGGGGGGGGGRRSGGGGGGRRTGRCGPHCRMQTR